MYLVIELQTNAEGIVSNIVLQYNNLAEAWAKYYTILSFAATSAVPVHCAVIMDNTGNIVAQRYFEHPVVTE